MSSFTSKRNPAYVGVVDDEGNLMGTESHPLVMVSGEPQGTAQEQHVLAGKTFQSSGGQGVKVGTMQDHTGQSPQQVTPQLGIPTEIRIPVPEGFYKGNDPIFPLWIYEPNLIEEKIPQGVTILGINGSYTSDADATAADIRQGKTAYVNGVKITGTAVIP